MYSGAVVDLHEVRAQLVMQPVMRPLLEEKDIVVADEPRPLARCALAGFASRSGIGPLRVHDMHLAL